MFRLCGREIPQWTICVSRCSVCRSDQRREMRTLSNLKFPPKSR